MELSAQSNWSLWDLSYGWFGRACVFLGDSELSACEASPRQATEGWSAMIETLHRKMNRAERAFLMDLVTDKPPTVTLKGTFWWSCVWSVAIVICGALVGVMLALEINPLLVGLAGGPVLLFAIASLYAIIALWSSYIHWSRYEKRFRDHDAPEIKRALEDGHVTVKKVVASAVIEIVEFDDEGGGYIFDVGDHQVLFLKGQHFITVDEEMEWPSNDFEIVRTAVGNRWVGIFSYGTELLPIRSIETSDCRDDIIWSDHEQLVQTDLQSFARSLLA